MLRRVVVVGALVAGLAAVGAPSAEARRPLPWGERIVVVPGACVTEPCALPIVVTVPEKPHPALPD